MNPTIFQSFNLQHNRNGPSNIVWNNYNNFVPGSPVRPPASNLGGALPCRVQACFHSYSQRKAMGICELRPPPTTSMSMPATCNAPGWLWQAGHAEGGGGSGGGSPPETVRSINDWPVDPLINLMATDGGQGHCILPGSRTSPSLTFGLESFCILEGSWGWRSVLCWAQSLAEFEWA